MEFGLPAVLVISGFTLAVAGALLLLSWLLHRSPTALALWGVAFAMGAIATVLIAARGNIADVWSIVAANTVLAGAYGLMWSGARKFESRKLSATAAAAGVAVWLLACTIPSFYATPAARAALMAAIGMSYTLLTVRELWRSRGDGLLSRWPIIALLTLHAATLPTRIPLVAAWAGAEPIQTNLLTFVLFESILLSMAGAYLFGSLVKERVASVYKQAASVDPLTGVANRRAYLQQGTRMVLRASADRNPIGLLLFDLDGFKGINDAHGHAVGDRVLTTFCQTAIAQLRPNDLFARMGGEEFACLLPDVTAQDAMAIAERVRLAFEATVHTIGEQGFGATVSVGVAFAAAERSDLPSLLVSADRALYRAKREGRNRVVSEEHVSAERERALKSA